MKHALLQNAHAAGITYNIDGELDLSQVDDSFINDHSGIAGSTIKAASIKIPAGKDPNDVLSGIQFNAGQKVTDGSKTYTYNGANSSFAQDQPPSSATNDHHDNSGSSGTSAPSTPSCNANTPVGVPDLFQIDRQGKDAVLWFSPVRDHTDQYHVVFGHQDGEEKYGGIALHVNDEQNNGVQSITVHELAPGKQYSFQVMAVNGCAVGSRSNWLTVKPATTPSNAFTKTYRYTDK
jgi:hypothetical protein